MPGKGSKLGSSAAAALAKVRAPSAPAPAASAGGGAAAAAGAGAGAGAASSPAAVLVTFAIHYQTKYGENLVVAGNTEALGHWEGHKAHHLNWAGNGVWTSTVAVPIVPGKPLEYKYAVRHVDGNVQWESGDNRVLNTDALAPGTRVDARDEWRAFAGTGELFHRSSFRDVIFKRDPATRSKATPAPAPSASKGKVTIRFAINYPRVDPAHKVYICGAGAELGDYDIAKAVPMSDAEFPLWSANVELDASAFPVKFKYVIASDDKAAVYWEFEDDRQVGLNAAAHSTAHPVPAGAAAAASETAASAGGGAASVAGPPGGADAAAATKAAAAVAAAAAAAAAEAPPHVIVTTVNEFRLPSRLWRGAGVAVPVFSLRTDRGMGVGEFLDIKELVDWASSTGQSMVQILPINDTCVYGTWQDSYPYNSVSVFALHPIYMNLAALGPHPAALEADIEAARARLNADATAPLDYEAVMDAKIPLLKRIFLEQRDATFASAEFKAFFESTKDWLQPYALFCFLRDLTGCADPTRWGERSKITFAQVQELTAPDSLYYAAVSFWYFVQFQLHRQLLEASQYAQARHVVIKGDLPIGVARFGVDAWLYPHLFNMNTSTGAPPDYFATDGQNWGFPTYNWDEMAKDNFAWWRRRLSQMAVYFQAYRIDHILGFFRIWSIPAHGVTGLLGRFSPAVPLWRDELERNGLWDVERLTQPYIRDWHIGASFGVHYEEAKHRFFDYHGGGVFSLKNEYATEKQIEAAITEPYELWMRAKLYAMRTNVVLLRDEHDGNQYHPRILMEKTSSFAELPDHMKEPLKRLYVDYFFKRQEGLWADKAMQKLPVMKGATAMLVCGEDLGMVPDCVPGVMEALSLLSLKVQRMPADEKKEFGFPSEYEYFSVCTTSSHDTSTLRGWWEEDEATTASYYRRVLARDDAPPRGLTGPVARNILEQHLYCESMWAVFPIQDWLAVDEELRLEDASAERINVPSNPKHYWRWRLHIKLEDLKRETRFNDAVRAMVAGSGRAAAY